MVEETGFRATVGKCMMDKGDDVPAELQEQTRASIEESLALLEDWHGAADGRIRYCFAPRFAISCTRELLAKLAELATRARRHGSHACIGEQERMRIVERETGLRNIAYLDSLGFIRRARGAGPLRSSRHRRDGDAVQDEN